MDTKSIGFITAVLAIIIIALCQWGRQKAQTYHHKASIMESISNIGNNLVCVLLILLILFVFFGAKGITLRASKGVLSGEVLGNPVQDSHSNGRVSDRRESSPELDKLMDKLAGVTKKTNKQKNNEGVDLVINIFKMLGGEKDSTD